MDKNEACTEEAHTRIDAVDKKVSGQDSQIDKLELQLANASASSTGVYVPTEVVISGFCRYEQRHEQGISRDEAEKMMETIKGKMAKSLKDKVGEIHLRCFKVHRFRVDVAADFAPEIEGYCSM